MHYVYVHVLTHDIHYSYKLVLISLNLNEALYTMRAIVDI